MRRWPRLLSSSIAVNLSFACALLVASVGFTPHRATVEARDVLAAAGTDRGLARLEEEVMNLEAHIDRAATAAGSAEAA